MGIVTKNLSNINRNYIPIKFTPTYVPLSIISEEKINKFKMKSLKNTSLTKIVELIWNKDKWKLLKIRDDRQIDVNTGNYFGNDHRIAEITWHSIFWPLKLEHLLNSKKKYIDNLSTNSDVEKNKMYFYKLYTFCGKKHCRGWETLGSRRDACNRYLVSIFDLSRQFYHDL